MARGLSNAARSPALFVAETTVKTYVGRVLHKLGLRDRPKPPGIAYVKVRASCGGATEPLRGHTRRDERSAADPTGRTAGYDAVPGRPPVPRRGGDTWVHGHAAGIHTGRGAVLLHRQHRHARSRPCRLLVMNGEICGIPRQPRRHGGASPRPSDRLRRGDRDCAAPASSGAVARTGFRLCGSSLQHLGRRGKVLRDAPRAPAHR